MPSSIVSIQNKVTTKEAMQFTGKNGDDIQEWVGSDGAVWNKDKLSINTLEGTMTANAGDYIIKGLAGEFYPCEESIFHKSYSVV